MMPPPHITRLSRGLYWSASVLLGLLPFVVVLALWNGWADPAAFAARFPGLPPATQIAPVKALGVMLIGALTLPFLIILLAQMRALFARYAAGDVLSAPCARHIRRIGQMLVALALLGVLVPTLQVLALTWDNPEGQKVLTIGLTGETLGFVLAGGLMTVIGWVMGAAGREVEAFV